VAKHWCECAVVIAFAALVLVPAAPGAAIDSGEMRSRCPKHSVQVTPAKKIQATIDRHRPGTVYCINSGVYRLRSSIRPHRGDVLVFEKGAVLKGSRLISNWERDGGLWKAVGQSQSFHDPRPNSTPCELNPIACEFEDLFRNGRPLTRVSNKADLTSGTFYFDETANVMFVKNDPNGHRLEATIATTAIEAKGVEGVTIRGATITQFAHAGIVTSNDWTIKNVDISYIHSTGIKLYGGSALRKSHIHSCGNLGLTGNGNDLKIVKNEFSNNNYLHFGRTTGPWHAGAAKIFTSKNALLRGNYSHDNFGDGWWFDTDNIDVVVEENLFANNHRYGLAYEASFRATIRANTFRRNGSEEWRGSGLWVNSSRDLNVYNNIIAGNLSHAIAMTSSDRGRSQHGKHETAHVNIHDNKIRISSGYAVKVSGDNSIFTSNNLFEENSYVVGDVHGSWWHWKGAAQTWAAWRSLGHDLTGSVSAP
jgi:hypothetical protein